MKVYKVSWHKPYAIYVPPDPCVGGGYYADHHDFDLVTVDSKATARAVVEAARPGVKIDSIRCLTRKKMSY